jgi:hypothetical protein
MGWYKCILYKKLKQYMMKRYLTWPQAQGSHEVSIIAFTINNWLVVGFETLVT